MSIMRNGSFALALVGSAALLATPSFAVEPDVDSPAGPELPAPRDHPDFQPDDQTGAPLERDIEGTDRSEGPIVIAPDGEVIEPGPTVEVVPE